MNYTQKKKSAESKSKKVLTIVVLVSLILIIVVYLLTPPNLNDNFCPDDNNQIQANHYSVLIDVTDSLSKLNRKIVDGIVFDWLERSPPMQKLAVYSLNTATLSDFEDIDTICSPPNASLLSFKYGRQKALNRINEFKKRLMQSIDKSSITTTKLNDSKILESVRQITNSPNWFPGSSRLVLISDLIEKSSYANFYSRDVPDFEDWVKINSNKDLLSSISLTRGDKVQICQLHTDKPNESARRKAKEFWVNLIAYKGVDEVFEVCNGMVNNK